MLDSTITVATSSATLKNFSYVSYSMGSCSGLPSLLLSLYIRHDKTAAMRLGSIS